MTTWKRGRGEEELEIRNVGNGRNDLARIVRIENISSSSNLGGGAVDEADVIAAASCQGVAAGTEGGPPDLGLLVALAFVGTGGGREREFEKERERERGRENQ